MAPNKALAPTFVTSSAPGSLPKMAMTKFTSRLAMPPWFIRLPAKMKKGDGRQAELAHAHEDALGACDNGDVQGYSLQNGDQGGDANGVGDGYANPPAGLPECR